MLHTMRKWLGLFVVGAALLTGRRLPAAQNPPPHIPAPGIVVPEADRNELAQGVEALGKDLADLRSRLRSDLERLRLLPDIEIFHKAIDWALRYDEFFEIRQPAFARKLLDQGSERARQLRDGKAPWLTAEGLIVRGYRSRLDGSVQPYGLVVPSERPQP